MEDRPEVSIHPPTVFFSALLIGYILRVFLGGWLPLPRIIGEGAGGLMMVAALIMAVSAITAFAEAGEKLTPASPSVAFFTDGPFRLSRNPIYLAMILFGVGFGLATLNIWIIAASILAGAIFNFFVIPQEEDYLARRFGTDYAAYRARVRRWL